MTNEAPPINFNPISPMFLENCSHKNVYSPVNLWHSYIYIHIFIYPHHINQKLQAAFDSNERQKKAQYNERVINVEHGSFTPIVLSAYGGAGRETERFFALLIRKIAEKRDVPISVVANYVRTKLSFVLVRSQVLWRRIADVLNLCNLCDEF